MRPRKAMAFLGLAGLLALMAFPALAQRDSDSDRDRTAMRELLKDIKSGKIKVEGDHKAVSTLVLQRNIPITYDYVATLMRTPNAFGEGPACIVCHSSADPARSYRGLDLSSCDGILKGATEAPVRKIVQQGKSGDSVIKRMLRNNRMPLGVSFLYPTDTPAIKAVRDWINAGAKDDEAFKTKVLPSMKDPKAFGGQQACVDCHMSNEEPPSFHELDLTSYKGFMLGADSVALAKEGKPPAKIIKPGNAAESKLYQRLVENRMPPGIDPSQDRDHANTDLLLRWIDQGAKCN